MPIDQKRSHFSPFPKTSTNVPDCWLPTSKPTRREDMADYSNTSSNSLPTRREDDRYFFTFRLLLIWLEKLLGERFVEVLFIDYRALLLYFILSTFIHRWDSSPQPKPDGSEILLQIRLVWANNFTKAINGYIYR